MIFSLALYLIGCAGWAKRLITSETLLRKRQLHGAIIGSLPLVMAVVFHPANIYVYAWSLIVGILGYITVVYRPKWIVGNR